MFSWIRPIASAFFLPDGPMTVSTANVESEPFVVATASVERTASSKYRIYLPKVVCQAVPWIAARKKTGDYPFKCLMLPGVQGGIQIDEIGGALAIARSDARSILSTEPPSAQEAAKEWVHLVRLLAGGAWQSDITTPSKPTPKLPDGPKECGVLSFEERTRLVFFASGSILEIWNVEPWSKYLREKASKQAIELGLYRQPFGRILETRSKEQ